MSLYDGRMRKMDLSKPYHLKLKEIIAAFPNKVAITCNGRSITFRELDLYSDFTAFHLYESGISPMDKVALWMSNTIEWVILQLALSKIGSVMVPINTRMRSVDACYVVEQSDSVALIIGLHAAANFENMAKEINEEFLKNGKPLQIICMDSQSVMKNGIYYFDCYGQLDTKAKKIVDELGGKVSGDDLFGLYYTSGTTGYPKGTMLVQGVVVRHTSEIAKSRNITPDDVLFLPLPLFGIMALQGLFGTLLHGGSVVLQDGFDAQKALELIETEKCTIVYCIEAMCLEFFIELNRNPIDFSHLKMVSVSPSSKKTIEKILTEWKVPVIRGYGLSEASSVVTSNRFTDPFDVIVNTNGYPLKDIQIKIVDIQTLKECKLGDVGEIWIKGYTVMKGYYNKISETQEVLTEDGWLRTYDAGFLDEEGRLTFVDRIKDIYKSGGFNVSPTEVENFIKTHPKVKEVAIIGFSDVRLGEIGVAFIVHAPNGSLSNEDIIQFCKDRIASFKIPRKVLFVDSLPKTPTGKVKKVTLKEMYRNKVNN